MSARPSNRYALACALVLASGAAAAQQHDHAAMQMQDMPGMDMSSAQHASTSSKPVPTKQAAAPPSKPTQATKPDPHAAHHDMAMPMQPGTQASPAARTSNVQTRPKSKAMPVKQKPRTDPARHAHADHAMTPGMEMDMPDATAMEHMDHAAQARPGAAPTALPPPTPEELAAAFPDLGGMDMSLHMDDNPTVAVLRGDHLEHVEGGATAWDARFGVGGNFDKLWLRSEGEQRAGAPAEGRVELQWTHATGPWWDRVVSLRSDFGAGPSRQWAGIGVAGLAPYKFEVEAHLYVGQQGRLAARLEGEYELLLTNRLILQPRVEVSAYSKDDPANRVGRGLSEGQAALRLRYEFTRQFAPYVGYAWSRHLGDTADLLRAEGRPAQEQGWVAGLRFWF
jgi:copper resistance protein B